MNPEVDMTNLLIAGVASVTLVAGTNIFEGAMRESDGTLITAPTVFVTSTGAGALEPYLSGGAGNDFSKPIVRVLVVGSKQAYGTGRTLAREILTVGHKAVVAGYTSITCIQAEPMTFEDEEGRPMFSLTFQMTWKEAR